ncbi:glycine oxidase ThiO [Aeoliella sp. ICT_H6.2]|uniref:Glycine oxidase ThiO n=1 Tax=Aeoliella straminimaris TaxID=2954799 RepID=A0A9X2FAK2_9BACT|nr:glycine oxidase ThiO [Aeoliella straminimaris]MCO6045330.1 glycine oxidase ThiO [Aeoliella straminimaris]
MLPNSCEVLVIGGGVVGLSIAYELAVREAGSDIVVVDRQTPGQEASWAGAGILPPGSWYDDHPALEQLAAISGKMNAEWTQRLAETTGIDNQLTTLGALHLANTTAQHSRLSAKFSHWRTLGIRVESVELDQIDDLEPNLNTDGALAAFHVPGEASIHNRQHCQALVAACESLGVRICHPAEVQQIVRTGNHAEQVETSAGSISVGHVILAAGAWSPVVAESLDLRISVRPVRGQMLSFGPLEQLPLRGIVHRGDQYMVPRVDGRLLVGSTVEEAGFEKCTTATGTGSLEEFARQLVPELQQQAISDRWAGLRPASEDGLPYIGRVPGVHNTIVAAGHYRSGLQMASGTAAAVADLITGETPQLRLEPFRLNR